MRPKLKRPTPNKVIDAPKDEVVWSLKEYIDRMKHRECYGDLNTFLLSGTHKGDGLKMTITTTKMFAIEQKKRNARMGWGVALGILSGRPLVFLKHDEAIRVLNDASADASGVFDRGQDLLRVGTMEYRVTTFIRKEE